MTVNERLRIASVLLVGLVAVSPAFGQTPTLQYDPPQGFIGGRGWMDPLTFVDATAEGSVEVHRFRPFQGDFRAAAVRTLFAERMSPNFSQPRLMNTPTAQPVTIPGAEDALMISFAAQENFYSYVHARLLMLAGRAVAIVDIRARTPERLQADWPAVNAMLQSIRVVPGPPDGSRTGGAAAVPRYAKVAGLYIGTRSMWQGNPFGSVGSGTWQASTYWYLLAADGRVQRGYRVPRTPNGDIALFDYDEARREAPQDSGTFTVDGTHITFVMGMDTVEAELTSAGDLSIEGSPFRKSLKES